MLPNMQSGTIWIDLSPHEQAEYKQLYASIDERTDLIKGAPHQTTKPELLVLHPGDRVLDPQTSLKVDDPQQRLSVMNFSRNSYLFSGTGCKYGLEMAKFEAVTSKVRLACAAVSPDSTKMKRFREEVSALKAQDPTMHIVVFTTLPKVHKNVRQSR